MNKQKAFYRFITAVLAMALFVSIGLPSGLHAYGMDAFCISNMEHEPNPAAGVHDAKCDLNNQDKTSVYFSNELQGNSSCDLSFACACDIDETPIKAEAAPTTVKAKVILSATVLDFTAELQPVQTPREVPAPNLNSSPPPVFLVNSSFLN